MTNRKNITLVVVSVLILFSLSSCLPGGGHYNPASPAGFFSGVWHGWTAPVSLVLGIFYDSFRIYEPYNSGWWYDFGFYISIISGFGGIQLFRKRRA